MSLSQHTNLGFVSNFIMDDICSWMVMQLRKILQELVET